MKKTKILVLMLIILLLIIFPLTINAAQINPDDYSSDGPNAADVKKMYNFGGKIAGVIQIAGTIVAVGTLIVIGIRYVVGSVEEKAEYKERMLPYIIGAVLLFGASNVVNVIYKTTRSPEQFFAEAQSKIDIIDGYYKNYDGISDSTLIDWRDYLIYLKEDFNKDVYMGVEDEYSALDYVKIKRKVNDNYDAIIEEIDKRGL